MLFSKKICDFSRMTELQVTGEEEACEKGEAGRETHRRKEGGYGGRKSGGREIEKLHKQAYTHAAALRSAAW